MPNGNGVDEAVVTIPNVGTASTTSSGFYRISAPQGSHTVSVTKSSLVSPYPKGVTISTGQNLTGLNFEMLPNAGSISGRISSGGEPLSNTMVYAINSATGRTLSVLNELNGSYIHNLKPGSWYIRAEKTGFLPNSTEVFTVGPGQQLTNKNLSLIKNVATVRGTITDGINPLRNVTVSVSKVSDS